MNHVLLPRKGNYNILQKLDVPAVRYLENQIMKKMGRRCISPHAI